MTGLTPLQRRALDFIRDYTLEHGHSPAFTEIAAGIGLSAKSKGRVHAIICKLEQRGHLHRVPGAKRSLALIPASPVLTVELPPQLYRAVTDLAARAKVTPEAVIIEAVRDGFKALRTRTPPHGPPFRGGPTARSGPVTQNGGDRSGLLPSHEVVR